MLKLYICPKCKGVRFVSKDNTICYKCNIQMIKSSTSYSEFISMHPHQRRICIEDTIQSNQSDSTS